MDGRESPDNIKNKPRVACCYHSDLDGFGAAFAVWTHLHESCELLFIPVQYSQEPPLGELRAFAPAEIMIVDFSYPAGVLASLAEEFGEWVTVIDHHKTALPELQAWGGKYVFDLTRSGATLTWVALTKTEEPIPEILLYVEDRDLWRFDLEHSKEINAFIATLPWEFEAWADFFLPEAYDAGKAILRFQAKQIEGRVKAAKVICYDQDEFKFFERRHEDWHAETYPLIPIVNASENISELGAALCAAYPDAPFSVSYCDRPDGKRSFSLRSAGDFDVSEVAKEWNGGGHRGAAGFTLPSPDIF